MRLSSVLLLIFVAQFTICPWAQATVDYTAASADQPATISGSVTTRGVGAVTGSGSATFTGDRISLIFDSADLTTKTPDLTGTTFKTRKEDDDHLTGFVFLDGGSQISKLDDSRATDTVHTIGGDKYEGRITDVSKGQMKIDTKNGTVTVDCNQIDKVKCWRIFRFSMSLTGNSVAFIKTNIGMVAASIKHTKAKTTPKASVSSSDNHRRAKRAVVVLVLLCLIATAIAVPVAVGVATHHSHHNNADQQAALFNVLRGRAVAPAAPAI